VFLMLNGWEIRATVDEQEELVLGVASSTVSRNELVDWLAEKVVGLSRRAISFRIADPVLDWTGLMGPLALGE
jgi:hypothetical protein